MEQKFNNNRLDLQILREFCEREGEEIAYRKGDQLEREGDPAQWFAFVAEREITSTTLLLDYAEVVFGKEIRKWIENRIKS